MTNKLKTIIGTAMVTLPFIIGVANAEEKLEVKARVCDGSPMTVITKNNKVIYGVTDVGFDTFKPSCYKRNRDPITYVVGYGNNTTEREQSCHYAKPNEKLNWSEEDIKPEDVKINNKDGKISIKVKEINCECPK